MRLPSSFGAVVTGGSSGLGRALCLQLAKRGGRIVVADVNLEGAEETAEMVRALGRDAWVVSCDVRKWDEVKALADAAEELAGPIDVVANNAGVAAGGNIGEIDLDDWHWTIDVNLWGVIHGCRAFVPAMRQRRRGWILNVSSAAGYVCLPQFGPYNVSKAGVIALSDTLRAETESLGIVVTVLCPSFFQTNIASSARTTHDDKRATVQHLMDSSRVSADDIARRAIKSMERGDLYGIPMADAGLAWVGKRALPQYFHRVMGYLGTFVERRAKAKANSR